MVEQIRQQNQGGKALQKAHPTHASPLRPHRTTPSTLMWAVRLASLVVGGSVSLVAIAALVTAIPAPQTSGQPSDSPLLKAGSNRSEPSLEPPPSGQYQDLPSVYPLSPPPPSIPVAPPPSRDWPPADSPLRPASGGSTTDDATQTPLARPTERPERADSLRVAQKSSTLGTPLDLTLQDVVILALENNRDIKNAYLNRIIEREALRVAEDRFNPDISPRITVNARRNDQGLSTATGGDVELATEMRVLFPTGTQLSAEWSALGDTQNTIGSNRGSSDGLGQRLSVEVRQPLWRNSGEAVTRAPLRIARLQEDQNMLALQSTLINTITEASQIYFSLVLAQQQLEIEQAGLTRTESEQERIEALIAVGREAGIQRIEADADVANRRVAVLAAENTLREAQLNLIQSLDIRQDVVPMATEANALAEDQIRFADDETLVEYALTNNPSYRSQLLDLDVAAIQLLQAEDQLGWDLDVIVGYSNDLSSRAAERSDARASLQLSRELGDRTLKQQVIAQRTQIEQLANSQTEQRENLEISIRDAIRDVDFQLTQVEQAQRATQLAAQQLDITQFQFRQGAETFLDVVQAQDQLVDSQSQELRAQIGYQQALLRLDQELGHTLRTWNIQVESVELP